MSAYEVITGPAPGQTFTARTFLDYLRRSNEHWWENSGNSAQCPWVFRGHADVTWKLTPSAARPLDTNQLRPLVEKLRAQDDLPNTSLCVDMIEEAKLLCLAHLQALIDFRDLAVGIGLSELPQVASEFKFDHPSPGNGTLVRSKFIWQNTTVCALAQHHGIPTFLLDWTRRGEIAAHFAANDPHGVAASKDIAVFALRHRDAPHREELPFVIAQEAPIKMFTLARSTAFSVTLATTVSSSKRGTMQR